MYRTCLQCTADLGANESVAGWPVGRRLAFDAARGRLWVVCGACRRWNLTPLEERWEAIEACERLFRATRARHSTDQIGLARTRDGIELIRIGAPPSREFAAWRYGAVFRRRRSRAAMLTWVAAIAGAGSLAGSLFGAPAFGAAASLFGAGLDIPRTVSSIRRNRRVMEMIETPHGPRPVRGKEAKNARLTHDEDGDLAVLVPCDGRETLVTGIAARRFLRRLLPVTNHWGATEGEIDRALTRLESEGGSDQLIRGFAGGPSRDQPAWEPLPTNLPYKAKAWHLGSFGYPYLLALEMALHEEQERHALEGELDALHDAWREAEEIAAIADSLLMPNRVEAALSTLRRGLRID